MNDDPFAAIADTPATLTDDPFAAIADAKATTTDNPFDDIATGREPSPWTPRERRQAEISAARRAVESEPTATPLTAFGQEVEERLGSGVKSLVGIIPSTQLRTRKTLSR
jgi:hypothetical protein